MRILHVTDTHLGYEGWFQGAQPGWRRADDHHDAFRRALGPALREEVDLVVHSGDVFNRSRPPERAVAKACALLAEVARRVPLVLIPGNHDRRGLRRYLPLRDVIVADDAQRVQIGEVALALVPYKRRADTWARAARSAVGPGVDLLVCHQAFHGVEIPRPGGRPFVFRVDRQRDTVGEAHVPRGISHILCGHIHPRQTVQAGQALVVHPGSTERTAFSEAPQTKGYARWTLGRQVQWQYVDLPSRPMAWVGRPDHLRRVAPGTLVRADPDLDGALDHDILSRGGWLSARTAPRPPPPQTASAQQTLFAAGG